MMSVNYERFCFPVTLKCNLRCKLCAEHAPYYERPYFPSLEDLEKQLEALFGLTNSIGKFDVTGGEPFLRKDLPKIMNHLFTKYRQQIHKLRVTTNGTMFPPEGFAEAARKWGNDFFVIVDNYEASSRSHEVADILRQEQISFELRDYSLNLHCDGWVDYGELTIKHTEDEAKQVFRNCVVPKLGFFTCMVNGYVFPCARARLLFEQRIAAVTADLMDEDLTVEGKKARMNALLGDEVIEACKYCDGLCEDSTRHAPAEQLTVSAKEARTSVETEDWKLNYGKVIFYTQTYNNEKTIARTIESVLNQTSDDYTYIICNNGSTDGTDAIIRHYAEISDKIIYVACEKNDVLAAITVPMYMFLYVPQYLDHYYCIVDGDDYLEPDFLIKVLNIIHTEDVDMIVPAYSRVNSESGEILNQRKLQGDVVVSGKDKADRFTEFRSMLLCQWGKVYRYKKFRKSTNILLYNSYLKLPKWFHQLDTVSVLSIYYQCDRVAFIAEPVYNYAISSQSTYGNYLPDRIKNDVLMLQIYLRFLSKYPPISKRNHDFCYAVYLSLLYENLGSLFHTEKVDVKQKLSDLYDILSEEETVYMLTTDYLPEFHNLSNRSDFLDRIYEFVTSHSEETIKYDITDHILKELNRYGEYCDTIGGL